MNYEIMLEDNPSAVLLHHIIKVDKNLRKKAALILLEKFPLCYSLVYVVVMVPELRQQAWQKIKSEFKKTSLDEKKNFISKNELFVVMKNVPELRQEAFEMFLKLKPFRKQEKEIILDIFPDLKDIDV